MPAGLMIPGGESLMTCSLISTLREGYNIAFTGRVATPPDDDSQVTEPVQGTHGPAVVIGDT
jgi:hypothetical protein